jgi:hypothetical protein
MGVELCCLDPPQHIHIIALFYHLHPLLLLLLLPSLGVFFWGGGEFSSISKIWENGFWAVMVTLFSWFFFFFLVLDFTRLVFFYWPQLSCCPCCFALRCLLARSLAHLLCCLFCWI